MTGTIYILRAGPYAKIGWAKNDVTGRAKLLQTGCPFPISVAREIPGSRRQEAALHRLFSDMRAHGEWFHWSDAMMTVEPPEVQPVQAPATDAGKAARIIEAIGGIPQFAALIGVTNENARKMRGRGSIPAKYWAVIARANVAGITLDDIA